MSVNTKSKNSNNVSDPVLMESIIADLEQATKKIHTIKKRYDTMQEDVKVSEMVQDEVMIEYSRMKSELADAKQQLKEAKKVNQGGDTMNYIIGEQKHEIEVLYSILKQYHIGIKDGLELAFRHRLKEENAVKFKKFIAKNIDAASHEVVTRLCANCELSSSKAVACAKFFRENTCQALPLPLFESDEDLMKEYMKCKNDK